MSVSLDCFDPLVSSYLLHRVTPSPPNYTELTPERNDTAIGPIAFILHSKPFHGVVAIFEFGGGISVGDALDLVLNFEMMERNNAASKARRSGQRHVKPSSSATKHPKHPLASAVDATQFSVDALCTLHDMLGFADHIDFVNLSKASINALFNTSCIYKKGGRRAKLLFPSKNHQRTLGQIQAWFKWCHCIGSCRHGSLPQCGQALLGRLGVAAPPSPHPISGS